LIQLRYCKKNYARANLVLSSILNGELHVRICC